LILGEVIVEVCALSIDGFLRTMMDENAYHGSLKLGDVLPAIGIGTVVKSNSSKLKVGAKVTGMLGAQKYSKTMDSSIFAVMSIPGCWNVLIFLQSYIIF
jgi:NADPH-dependent curcumin reductase CurA